MARHKRHEVFDFFGFTLFDAWHVLFGLFFLICSLGGFFGVTRNELPSAIIELVFAALLLVFIDLLSREHKDYYNIKRVFIFGSLVISAAIFTPNAATVGLIFEATRNETSTIIKLCGVFAALASFIAFFIALLIAKKNAWRLPMWIGYILVIAVAPLSVVETIMNEELTLVIKIVNSIAVIAPLFVGFYAIKTLIKDQKLDIKE